MGLKSTHGKPIVFRPRTSEPSLTVICPSYNSGRFMRGTLESIAAQDLEDFECWVIDGGSTDETLEILRRTVNLNWVSEPDKGVHDAQVKGWEIAQGRYLTHCCISDGYLDPTWLRRCVEELDGNPEASLVWGYPQCMTESGDLGDVSYGQFDRLGAPDMEDFTYYWLWFGLNLPEGNFVVRREALKDCWPSYSVPMPAFDGLSFDPHLEFLNNFHDRGYLAKHIPVVASYGRAHADSITVNYEGRAASKYSRWSKRRLDLRRSILFGGRDYPFRGAGKKLESRRFSKARMMSSWLRWYPEISIWRLRRRIRSMVQ